MSMRLPLAQSPSSLKAWTLWISEFTLIIIEKNQKGAVWPAFIEYM
jgi:hypothetical protein